MLQAEDKNPFDMGSGGTKDYNPRFFRKSEVLFSGGLFFATPLDGVDSNFKQTTFLTLT